MPAAVVKGSSSRWVRVLAALLTSNFFFLASCTGSMCLITVYGDKETKIESNSRRLPVPYGVAVVATIDPWSPKNRQIVAVFVKEPLKDLAVFRTEHSSYSFLPSSDRGVVVFPRRGEFGDINVKYQVSKRESGKAEVKTHYGTNIAIIGPQNVSATYEATDSDIRLVSFKSNPNWFSALLGAMSFTMLLVLVGQNLKRRVAPVPDPEPERPSPSADGREDAASEVRAPAWEVTIRYPRLLGIIRLCFEITIGALLEVLLLSVLVILVPPLWSAPGETIVVFLLVVVILVVFSWHLWYLVRNRESIFTTFRISPAALTIENQRYGVLTLTWDEISCATYSKIGIDGKRITLEAASLVKPLVIMSTLATAGSRATFVIAQMLMQRALGDRWIERWL